MSNPPSLDFMAACVRDVTQHAQNENVASGLQAAIRTLEWLAKGEAALKVLIALRRERPDTFAAIEAMLKVFPDAEITRVGTREAAE